MYSRNRQLDNISLLMVGDSYGTLVSHLADRRTGARSMSARGSDPTCQATGKDCEEDSGLTS